LPHDFANVIGDKQRAALIDRHADRTAERVALAMDKTGDTSSGVPTGCPSENGTKTTL
jgi:hypothetical protein